MSITDQQIEEWVQGPLPANVTREALRTALVEFQIKGLSASYSSRLLIEEFNHFQQQQQKTTIQTAPENKPEATPEPAQEASEDPKPGADTAQNENTSPGQLEAAESESEATASPVNQVDRIEEDPTTEPEDSSSGRDANSFRLVRERRMDDLRRGIRETIDRLVEDKVYKLGPNEYYLLHDELPEYERVTKIELRERLLTGHVYIPDWLIDDKARRIETDKFFEELFSRIKTVDHADPVAGYTEGYREYNGTKIAEVGTGQ